MISRHGYTIVFSTFIVFILFLIFFISFPGLFTGALAVLLGFISIFNLYFFRDPDRIIPKGDNLILSPADGTVIRIEEVEEPDYFKAKVQRLSIFLSVFNVHVNRIPISGKVDFLRYKTGTFVAAFEHKASEENEQSIIGISANGRKILFTQIAGVIARRIIYNLELGEEVTAGVRFGLIRYGSRVDIYFPPDVKLRVNLKDKVIGGETIIGEFI
jgi:phosphatidylserine decarboxylase